MTSTPICRVVITAPPHAALPTSTAGGSASGGGSSQTIESSPVVLTRPPTYASTLEALKAVHKATLDFLAPLTALGPNGQLLSNSRNNIVASAQEGDDNADEEDIPDDYTEDTANGEAEDVGDDSNPQVPITADPGRQAKRNRDAA